MIPACKKMGVMNLPILSFRVELIEDIENTYLHHWLGSLSWKPPNPQTVSNEQISVAGLAVLLRPATLF